MHLTPLYHRPHSSSAARTDRPHILAAPSRGGPKHAPARALCLDVMCFASLRVWAATGECVATLEGHTGDVYSVCSLGDGRGWRSSGSQDKTVRVWVPDLVYFLFFLKLY